MTVGPLPGTVPVFPGLTPGVQFNLPLPATIVQQTQVWQGQFPPPDAVRAYEDIMPGTFDRLVTMAEQAQTAQIKSLDKAQDYLRSDVKRGQYLGFVVSVVAMGAGLYCVHIGQAFIAGIFLAMPVMAVAKALADGARGVISAQQQKPEKNDAST